MIPRSMDLARTANVLLFVVIVYLYAHQLVYFSSNLSFKNKNRRKMASGMGVRGTIGRCYGFFADYKECQKDLRENIPDTKARKEGCYKQREDYFECLHSRKEYARVKTVLEEKKRQEQGISSSH